MLDPLHLDVAVFLPRLVVLQELPDLCVASLIQGSSSARLKPAMRGSVALERGPRDAAVEARTLHLRVHTHATALAFEQPRPRQCTCPL